MCIGSGVKKKKNPVESKRCSQQDVYAHVTSLCGHNIICGVVAR